MQLMRFLTEPMLSSQNKNRLIQLFLGSLLVLNPLSAQNLQKEVNFSKHKCLPGYGFKKMRHPEIFQGNNKKRSYFEGWYFKMVSADDSSILSVIPGIALSHDGKEQHAFIQIINGKTAKTDYYSFPIKEFAFSKKEFAIKIGQNYFSADKIILHLHTDSSSVSGKIQMTNHIKLNSHKILNPGIMGWYRFVPFMECYHAVVSLTNQLDGSLFIDGKEHCFRQGLGYIEKDWGSSMPSAWIWMQSNHFSKRNSSFMLSIANIPWLGKSFTGFLGFFLHDSILYHFATYTHATLSLEECGLNTIRINVKDRNTTFSIEASRNQAGLLKAPVKGSMDRRIPESVDAKLQLSAVDRNGKVIFQDSTSIAGLELVGNQKLLIQSLNKNQIE